MKRGIPFFISAVAVLLAIRIAWKDQTSPPSRKATAPFLQSQLISQPTVIIRMNGWKLHVAANAPCCARYEIKSNTVPALGLWREVKDVSTRMVFLDGSSVFLAAGDDLQLRVTDAKGRIATCQVIVSQ